MFARRSLTVVEALLNSPSFRSYQQGAEQLRKHLNLIAGIRSDVKQGAEQVRHARSIIAPMQVFARRYAELFEQLSRFAVQLEKAEDAQQQGACPARSSGMAG
jgi:hypothetical protein